MDFFNMKENAFTHYTRDNTLYNRLLDAASDDKLPILDNKSFELLNKTYGKDKMRTHLADYIASERPVFPLKEISKDDMRKCFYDLQKFEAVSSATDRAKSLRRQGLLNLVGSGAEGIIRYENVKVD